MKAQEVLRRYAAGERNFCNASLRGADFKGQNLSDGDFSGADIRSAKFTDSILRKANFTSAKGGLQRRWLTVQWLLIAILALVAGVLQAFSGTFAAIFLDPTIFSNPLQKIIGLGTYLLLVVVTYITVALQGFSIRVFNSILPAFAFAFAVIFAFAGTSAGEITVSFAVAAAVAITGAIAGAIAVTVAFAVAGLGAFAFAGTVAGVVAGTVAFAVAGAFAGTVAGIIAFEIAITGLLFSLFVGWRTLKEDEKFDTLRVFGLVIAAVGSTSFSGSDLTGARFTQAHLRSVNFANSRQCETQLNHVCWRGVRRLNRSRLGSSILQDRRVRMLLTEPEKGYKQDFSDVNLRGANLSGATLEKANLTRAILSDALLRGAVLKDATLTEAQAVNADFTNVCLTGATLESWNIDSTTIFRDIACEYVYLLEHPKEDGDRERRPHDINKMFQSGDFEKLFKEVQDEVQILIRNGVNPVALHSAFHKIKESYPNLSKDAFQGFQRRDEDVLVTVKVPQGTNKAEFERAWDSGYRAGLQAGREESMALLASAEKRADSLELIALTMAQNPSSIQNSQNMTGQDYSKTTEIEGNVDRSIIGQGDRTHLTNTPSPKKEDSP
ncbi:MAG: pentapeptide repeat-containing protein [Cyanobacteria bacterium J06560_6]